MPFSTPPSPAGGPRVGLLFDFDWDERAHARLAPPYRFDRAGFDLFSFPSNARLVGFDLDRFAKAQARRARQRGWAGVVSHHEQFGALAAALVAEAAGLPGTRPEAVLACQHKLHARRVMQQVCPQANLGFGELQAEYGGPIPEGIDYPAFVKPVKAAFSVLARDVDSRAQLHAHTRFGARELWVIRRLVEPFERIARERLPHAGTAHRMMLEEPVHAPQYNLDGYMRDGRLHVLGFVDAVMYPGTQAFMRFELPTRLDESVQARAVDVAQRFLGAVGFDHGVFNMEFFHDPITDRLAVIEFNPRLASQFGDLYRRVRGIDPHAVALALATGADPQTVPRLAPSAGAAASFVYRAFEADAVPAMPSARQRADLAQAFPDALLFMYPKAGHALARDFKWLGSHRYGILHLGGRRRRRPAPALRAGLRTARLARALCARRGRPAHGRPGRRADRRPMSRSASAAAPDPLRRRALACAAALAVLPGCTLAPDQDHDGADAPRAEPLDRPMGIAWVFSSGGPRGFVHVGVMRALDELGLQPDLIVGASVGALVGSLRAAGVPATQIEAMALDLQPISLARLALGSDARFSGAPLAELVREHSPIQLLQRMPVAMACVAARRRDREAVAFTAGDVGLAVQASSAIEGQFSPVRIRGEQYIDADWVAPLPVRLARALGARRVLAIDATAHLDRAPAGAERYRRGDLRKQALVDADAQLADLVLKPDFGYWVSLSREFRERAIEAGYQSTLAAASRLFQLHAS